MNILFTCAGRRNYLINYFKKALKGQGKVYASDMQLSAPALVDADVAIKAPAIYDKEYIAFLKTIVKDNHIDAIIPLNDLELPILATHKKELELLGVKVIVADQYAIAVAFDKWRTVQFLESLGLHSPRTYLNLQEAKKALKDGELAFPIVIKPRWGSASIGIDFPEGIRELELAYELQGMRLKRTILAEASKTEEDRAILIQEKLPGKEYGLDVLNDFNGNYVGTFVREKISMRSGETDKAISVIDLRFEKLGRKLGEGLKHLGNMDCDVFEKDGELYVLEMNPRFGGGYPFSHEAGMNTAAVYVEWLKGNTNIQHLNRYKEGLMFSKCDRMLKIN